MHFANRGALRVRLPSAWRLVLAVLVGPVLATLVVGGPNAPAGAAPASYVTAVLADGPVAYWQFNDPLGATQYADSSGNGQVLEAGASALTTPGIGGTDGALDASAGGATTAAPLPALTGDAPRSVEAWFNSTTGGCVLTAGSSGHSQSFSLCFANAPGNSPVPGTPGFYLQTWDADIFTPVANMTDGHWHYLALTLNGNSVNIVIDGSQPQGYVWNGSGYGGLTAQPFTLPFTPNTAATSLGVATGGWTTGMSGIIDEVAVYPTALPVGELASHYNLLQNGVGPTVQAPQNVEADSADGYAEVFWQPPFLGPTPTQYQVSAYDAHGQVGSTQTVCGQCTLGAYTSASDGDTVHFVVSSQYGGASASATSNMTTPANRSSDLHYYGGPVQNAPKLYVVFWLPDFNTANNAEYVAYINQIETYFQGMASSDHLSLLDQYISATSQSNSSFPLTIPKFRYQGAVLDTTNYHDNWDPGTNTGDAVGCGGNCMGDGGVMQEITNFLRGQGITPDGNTDIALFMGNGERACSPAGPFGLGTQCSPDPTNPSGSSALCAWHSISGGNFAVPGGFYYLTIPFPVGNSGCSDTNSGHYIPGVTDQYSVGAIESADHELAETITDPDPVDPGWCLPAGTVAGRCWNDPSEVVDLCGGQPVGETALPNGDNPWVQPWWQNLFLGHSGQKVNQCATSFSQP